MPRGGPAWLVGGLLFLLILGILRSPNAQTTDDKLVRNSVGATLKYTNRMIESYIGLFKEGYSQGSLPITKKFASEFHEIVGEVLEALKTISGSDNSIKMHYSDRDAIRRLDEALACKSCLSTTGKVTAEPRPRTFGQLRGVIERRLAILRDHFNKASEQSIGNDQISNIEEMFGALRTILLAYDPLEFAFLSPDAVDRLKAQLVGLSGEWKVGEYNTVLFECTKHDKQKSLCAVIISGPTGVGEDLLTSDVVPKGGFFTARVRAPETGVVGPARISVNNRNSIDISFCNAPDRCSTAEAKRVK